jgi:cytochrome c551/c552
MPFEMKSVKAMPDGFEIEFTLPVNKKLAADVNNYDVSSFTYKYHPVYGSPMVNIGENPVRGAIVSEDGLKVRIVVDALRPGYIHAVVPEGVLSQTENLPLLHKTAYYTLNAIPSGSKANVTLVTPKSKAERERIDAGKQVNSPDNQMKEAAPKGTPKPSASSSTVISDKEAMALLTKHTCVACHKDKERAVGPSFADIAKRKYTVAEMEALIVAPKPENWPDYSTPMAPMGHVPRADIRKLAAWINTRK